MENVNNIPYQFTALPTNLMMCCDNNIRSMLFTMVQLSSYYANDEGWFFRTNADLQAETNLSENLVRATISELYSQGIIEIRTVGAAKGTIPNYFRINISQFAKWETLSIEDAMKNPLHKIETPNYKAKGWKPSYLIINNEEMEPTIEITEPKVDLKPFPNVGKSEDNIDNRTNENHKDKESLQSELDHICGLLFTDKDWTTFKSHRAELVALMDCSDENTKRYIKKRLDGIENAKFKYFAKIAANSPYNEEWAEIYEKTGCGYKGAISLPPSKEEEMPKRTLTDEEQKKVDEYWKSHTPWKSVWGPPPRTAEEALEKQREIDNIKQKYGMTTEVDPTNLIEINGEMRLIQDLDDDELPF